MVSNGRPQRLRTASCRFAALLLLFGVAMGSAPAFADGDEQSDWRATVKVDSLTMYANASTAGKAVKVLKKGDVVIINLEIVGEGGMWCGVTEAGQPDHFGYVQSAHLEREQGTDLASWKFLPPPEPPEAEPAPDAEKPDSPKRRRVYIPIKKDEVQRDLGRFFASRFGRVLPVSAFGQTALHGRLGFDHRNAFDVAVHPDSPEGRALIAYLRSRNIPYITFRSAVRGIATGPHIHVGNPSPRTY